MPIEFVSVVSDIKWISTHGGSVGISTQSGYLRMVVQSGVFFSQVDILQLNFGPRNFTKTVFDF